MYQYWLWGIRNDTDPATDYNQLVVENLKKDVNQINVTQV